MQIEIEIQGLDKAKEIFKELEKFTSPEEQKKVMHTIGNMAYNSIAESFENKKSPFGQNWEPLKKSTLKAKKGKGDILRFSGDLQDKWTIEATSSRVGVYGNTTAKSYVPKIEQTRLKIPKKIYPCSIIKRDLKSNRNVSESKI